MSTTSPAADRQGSLDDGARLAGAMASFYADFGAVNAMRLDSCIHCGMCAEACHFYIATEDAEYTPILKVEPLKQAYRREAGAFAPLFRLLRLKPPVTEAELERWQHLLFDSCNLCGRCSLICPMGIDVTALIEHARRAMFQAGLAPRELAEKSEHQARTGQPEASAEPYRERLKAIASEYGVDIPLDRERAEILLCVPRNDLEHRPQAVAALARVMAHLGADCTFRSEALVAENYGYYAGSRERQRAISERIVAQAEACGARTVLVPECGHAYYALRWEAAELRGGPLPFRVLHVTEYLAEALEEGRLRVTPLEQKSVTFHDPCQLVRKGGVQEAPRRLLAALGMDLKELRCHQAYSFCCTGGGGVYDIERARPLRYRALEPKLREIDATGADELVTSCSDCRETFSDAQRHFDWDKTPRSLLEMVAEHLTRE